MMYALGLNNELIEARPKESACCPNCNKKVFSKCGEIRVWHWSHHKDESCAFSNIKDSLWRSNWIRKADKNKTEKFINGQVVDIVGENQSKIIFVNKRIEIDEIKMAEDRLKERIIWVINLEDPKYLVFIYSEEFTLKKKKLYSFKWRWAQKEWVNIDKTKSYIILDLGEKRTIIDNFYGSITKFQINSKLLYVKELKLENDHLFGKAVELDEEVFIKRYM